MTRPSSATLRATIVVVTAVAVVGVAAAQRAAAEDVVFLCSDALQSGAQTLLPEFEQASGHQVKVTFANVNANAERLRKGEAADLVIVSPRLWKSLHGEAKLDPAVQVVIGKVGLGVFTRKGAARPDIGSVEAFKRALLNARSIAIRDPRRGSPVGALVTALFERLGIAEAIKPKLMLTEDRPYQAVVGGQAEIGFSTLAEITASPEVDLVGPVPIEVRDFITYTAAIPANAKQPAAAKALLAFLTSARAAAVFKAAGLEPE